MLSSLPNLHVITCFSINASAPFSKYLSYLLYLFYGWQFKDYFYSKNHYVREGK